MGDSSNLILVLDSVDRGVGWRLAVVGESAASLAKVTVALSPGSRIISSNVEVDQKTWFDSDGVSGSLKSLLEASRTRFGAVSLAATVEEANRVSVLLSEEQGSPSVCSVGPTDDNLLAAVTAFHVRKQPTKGCFHEHDDLPGTAAVHVIDLDSPDGLGGFEPAAVYLSLSPDGGQGGSTVTQDLSLVLRSAEPVRWLLQSKLLSGRLDVVTGRRSACVIAPNHEADRRRFEESPLVTHQSPER